jgi:hypothetical protein
MTKSSIKKLHRGDEVHWIDPDNGICSRYYKILSILIKGDIVTIVDMRGDVLECYAWELS